MSKFIKISAIALFILGVLMAVFAFFTASNPKVEEVQRVVQPKETKAQLAVVTAARDLPAGHLLTEEDVVVTHLEQMPEGSFATPHLVQGRTLAEPVKHASVITEQRLVAGLAGLLAEGERAISINVNEAMAVGHKLKPGDWVDVFVVMNRDGQDVESAQARLLLPQKKILAYGEKLLLAPATKEDDTSKAPGKQVARTAVLAVPVEEINRLLLAEKQGQLQLALRSPLDRHEPSADILKQIPGMTVPTPASEDVHQVTAALDGSLSALKTADLVVDAAQPAAKAKAAPKVERVRSGKSGGDAGASVEIIRGTQREMLRY